MTLSSIFITKPKMKVYIFLFSHEVVSDSFATPWTVARQASLKKVSRGLSRVEAGNPGFPRLVQVTSGGFSWWL